MSSIAAMWAPLLFGFALFLGSALLFFVQPMIGRTLLPHLGGSTLAWNACLVFFQATLLAGYVYADLIHRFRGLRWQPWLHLVLMAAATTLCFAGLFGDNLLNSLASRITSFDSWPVFSTICLLVVVIAVPFFALAAVGPLVQRWFAHLDHPRASDPYFLFVASNLGGLTALIFYPAFIEPHAPMYAQWLSWKLAMTALGVVLLLVAICVWASPRNPELEPPTALADPNAPAIPKLIGRGPATWPRRLFWLAASALPVGLMMGVTDYLTLDVAPTPMLWTLPLALYLLAFSQSFARYSPLDHGGFIYKLMMQITLGMFLGLSLVIVVVALLIRRNPESSEIAVFMGIVFLLILIAPQTWFAVLQPITVILVVLEQANIFPTPALGDGQLGLHLLCFYTSARLCLGMLAEDRPAATSVTTYFTWIGIGGLCGGLFQLVIAPLLFRRGYLEYSLLAALASTMRPAWTPNGLTDWAICTMLFPSGDSKDTPPSPARRWLALAGDLLLPFVVAIAAGGMFFFLRHLVKAPASPQMPRLANFLADFPLALAILLAAVLYMRPRRFGFALALIVLFSFIGSGAPIDEKEKHLVRQRTPYGLIRVVERTEDLRGGGGQRPDFVDPDPLRKLTERRLTHATTHHGSSIIDPPDLRRYPTTYYHEYGPVGRIMLNAAHFAPLNVNRHEWRKQHGEYLASDARIAASLVAMSAVPTCTAPFPMETLSTIWSEPPFAIVGLGTGTLYAYARPYQWVDAYELDPAVVALSGKTADAKDSPIFPYALDAKARGVRGEVFVGDARRNLAKPGHEGFYQMIFVDVFNSDAIPTHLLTEQALVVYFQKLAPDGIICIHTSNRHVVLTRVLEKVTQKLDVPMRVTRASPDFNEKIPPLFFSSEWVLITRHHDAMNRWVLRGGLDRMDEGKFRDDRFNPRFDRPRSNLAWTDEHASPMSALRSNLGWSALVYTLLVVIIIFGLLQGVVEIIVWMTTPTVTRKPPAQPEAQAKPARSPG